MHPIMAVLGISFCFFLTVAMLESVPGGWRMVKGRRPFFGLGFCSSGLGLRAANSDMAGGSGAHTYFFLFRWDLV